MDLTWLAASGFIASGVALGVLLEHWLLWWLLHRPPRMVVPPGSTLTRSPGFTWGDRRPLSRCTASECAIPAQQATLPPPARLPHAGHLVQRGRVAAGSLQVPDLDTRVR